MKYFIFFLNINLNFSIQIHSGKLTVHISNKTSYISFINSLEAATIINENTSFKW